MTSRTAVRRGSQTPTYQLVPPAKSSAGQETIDLAASAGLILEPHQQLVLHGALGERPDHRWAAFEVGVVEPRQNGKGGIVAARQLAGLYLFGEALQTYTAHRMDSVMEGFHKIRAVMRFYLSPAYENRPGALAGPRSSARPGGARRGQRLTAVDTITDPFQTGRMTKTRSAARPVESSGPAPAPAAAPAQVPAREPAGWPPGADPPALVIFSRPMGPTPYREEPDFSG